jgi:thiamine biosynthesis lipoprotein
VIRWRALGTHVDLLVHRGDARVARAAVEAVLEDVDRAYSRFRPDSELVALNARAGSTVEISPLLAQAIGAAITAARQTDGLCDPTIGRALLRIGYDADFATVTTSSAPIELRMERVAGWQSLRFDAAARTFRAPLGVELDLGSTGKALAADLAAAAAVAAMGRGGVLVSLGGDLAIAGDVPADGWPILTADDSSVPPTRGGETIALRGGAVATSSTTVRTWRRASVVVHHLIDPRTGLPAQSPWRTVSVAAASCVDANAAATAGLIRGADAPRWLESLGVAARFVGHDGEILRVGGWPRPDPARTPKASRRAAAA